MKRICIASFPFLVVARILSSSNVYAQTFVLDEYFNNYGSTANLNTKGTAGNGWQSGWTGSILPKYQSGSQLQYIAPGYSPGGNDPNPVTSGLAHSGAPGAFHLPNPDGVDPNSIALRSLTPRTGTIWISAVTILDTGFPVVGDGEGTILWLEPNSSAVGGPNYIGIRSDVGSSTGLPEPLVKYANTTDGTNNTAISRGPPALLLARIIIDASGTSSDSVDFWVNPNLTTGLAGLNAQVLYSKTGVDIFGPSFDSIGVSFANGLNLIDSIRISDDLQGVLVPEPAAFVLAAIALLQICVLQKVSFS